jgi:hypothetical protein
MALIIHKGSGAQVAAKADRRLYLNAAQDRVVEEGVEAASLFASAGSDITAQDMARFGLSLVDGVIAPADTLR